MFRVGQSEIQVNAFNPGEPMTARSLQAIEPNAEGWVNTRELHRALQVKTKYTDWVKRRLMDNRATIGSDYIPFQSFEKGDERGFGNRTKTDYYISTFMAEHFAMMENTPAGHRVRNVYIKCRHAAHAMAQENARLAAENAKLKEPKQKRLGTGRVQQTITHIVETEDMFGNVERTVKKTRKYVDNMTDAEQRAAGLQHMSRVQEGLAKRIKQDMNFEDVKAPTENELH